MSFGSSDFNHVLLCDLIVRLRSRSASERKDAFSTAIVRPRQQINIAA